MIGLLIQGHVTVGIPSALFDENGPHPRPHLGLEGRLPSIGGFQSLTRPYLFSPVTLGLGIKSSSFEPDRLGVRE